MMSRRKRLLTISGRVRALAMGVRLRLAQDQEMVKALAAHRAEEPFADRVLFRRPVGCP